MEFRKSSVPRPEPLRIIKRSETVKNSRSVGEIAIPRRGASRSADFHAQLKEQMQSDFVGKSNVGTSTIDILGDSSPPYVSDGRLTIRKKRASKKPIPVPDESSSSSTVKESRILEMIKKSRIDSEPEMLSGTKENYPKPLSLNRDSSEKDTNCLSEKQPVQNSTFSGQMNPTKDDRSAEYSQNDQSHLSKSDIGLQPIPTNTSTSSFEKLTKSLEEGHEDLQRKISTSRKLFRRAKDGLGSLRLKSRKPSKPALIDAALEDGYMPSRNLGSQDDHIKSGSRSPTSRISTDCGWSVVSRKYGSEARGLVESTSLFRPMSKSEEISVPYVLVPEISIFPEVDSIRSDKDYMLRVAVTITGALKPAYMVAQEGDEANRTQFVPASVHEKEKYGTMRNIDVAFLNMLGHSVENVIAPVQPLSIGASDSCLFLLGVNTIATNKLGSPFNGHVRATSDELINNLTSQLGLIQLQYLCVRITYEHSAFQYHSENGLPAGCNYHTTRLETEAKATITLLPPASDSLSSWSRRVSSINLNNSTSSLMFEDVLRSSLTPAEVSSYTELMSSWTLIDPVQVIENAEYDLGTVRRRSIDRSSDTVIPPEISTSASIASFKTAKTEFNVTPLRFSRNPYMTPSRDSDENNREVSTNSTPKVRNSYVRPKDLETPDYNPSDDPASKIWKEMRKHSTGSKRRKGVISSSALSSDTNSPRTSHSTDSNNSIPSEMSMGTILPPQESPSITSGDSLDDTPRAKRTGTGYQEEHEEDVFWQEKEIIRQEALRNKRSISADTVHSLVGGSSGQRGIGIRAGFWGLFG